MTVEMLPLRTSERTTFARCKQKWWWGWRELWTPRQAAVPLRFGDLVHQALALYYVPSKVRTRIVRGPHPAESFLKLYDEQLVTLGEMGMYTEEEEWVTARELGVEMLTNYINFYGTDDRYRVIRPELTFQVDLYDENDVYLCTYVGTFDALVEDLQTHLYGLMEHKTAKVIKTNHLTLDEQAGSYWAFAPYVLEEKLLPKMDFVLYNFLRKGKKDDRETNELGQALNLDGTVSKRQASPLFHREVVRRNQHQQDAVLERVAQQAKEIREIDNGGGEIWKTPTRDCSWDCEFFAMCELHEAGADWQSYRDATMVTWNPYEAHGEMIGLEAD